MGNFYPLSKERAEEIRAILQSRPDDKGLALSPTGAIQGTAPVNTATTPGVKPLPDDRRNVVARFDTHY